MPHLVVAVCILLLAAPSLTFGTTPPQADVSHTSDASETSGTSAASPRSLHDLAEVIRDDRLYPVTLTRHHDASEATDSEHTTAEVAATTASDVRHDQHHNKPAVTVMDEEEGKERARRKRDAGNTTSKEGRVLTGATILNIRGSVRDSIADGSAPPSAPSPRASRLDTFVIRPAAPAPLLRPSPRTPPPAPASPAPRLVVAAPRASVTLPCDLRNVTDLRWYRDGEEVMIGSGAAEWAGSAGAVRVRAARGEEGQWACGGVDAEGQRTRGEHTRLALFEEVRGVYLSVDGRRLDAGNTWVPLREKATLEIVCVAEGGVPPPALTWRLMSADATLDARLYLTHDFTDHSAAGVSQSRAVLTASRELHNAWLECRATQPAPAADEAGAPGTAGSTTGVPEADARAGNYNATPATAKIQMHVTYPPSFVISRWPGFGVGLVAGAGAALRCDVDSNPPARARWHRDGDTPAPEPAPAREPHATLVWPALQPHHAGWYRCRAGWGEHDYSSIGYYLNVREPEEGAETEPTPDEIPDPRQDIPPRAHSSRGDTGEDKGDAGEGDGGQHKAEHEHVEVPLGGAVQLHCPKGSVGCWWRHDGEEWVPAGSHHAHGVLGIKNAIYEEGGEYRCVGARDRGPMRDLKRVTLDVTGAPTATALAVEASDGGWRLTCAACGRGLAARWLAAGAVRGAALRPAKSPHCFTATTTVPALPHEVLCVVTSSRSRTGAVAVFPPRAAPAPRALLTAGAGAPHAGRAGLVAVWAVTVFRLTELMCNAR